MTVIGYYLGVRVEVLNSAPQHLLTRWTPDEVSADIYGLYGVLSRNGRYLRLVNQRSVQWFRAPSMEKAEQVMRQHRRCARTVESG